MTPPLSPRHSTYPRLASPASSPNLSSRSAPPTITVDDSTAAGKNSSSGPDLSTVQQKVLQLPPVKTWYPKGESMFNSILDSRSPQVYRRTAVAGGSKTASYPQSNQSSITPGSSRVSWPQRSKDLKSSEENISPPMLSVSTDNSDRYSAEKSPRLLRKCTSFDMERSRPFPARSKISSPMMLRKVSSFDDADQSTDHSADPTPKDQEWANDSTDNELFKIVHREEDESSESPHCESVADITQHNTVTAAIADSGYHEFVAFSETDDYDTSKINESLEDPNIPETDILDDFVSDFDVKHNGLQSETDPLIPSSDLGHSEIYIRDKNDQPQPKMSIVTTGSEVSELGAKPKTKKASADVGARKVSKTKTKSDKAQISGSPKLLKSKSHSGPIIGKSEKTTDKHKHRSSTSAVKSALLSSAAKIKAISRKSPVMLLSYKSRSISIPDHTDEPFRLTSASVSGSSPRPKKGAGVHHTESSPEVLMAATDSPKIKTTTTTAKPLSKDSPSSSTSSKSAASSKSSSSRKTSSEQCKTSGSDQKKPTRPSALSTGKEKSVKSPPAKDVPSPVRIPTSAKGVLAKSYSSDRQGANSTVSSTSKSTLRSRMSGSAATKAKSDQTKITSKMDPEHTKGDNTVTKPRMQKRGSVSSVNSDSSKKCDHFHDCCHGRRRHTEKK